MKNPRAALTPKPSPEPRVLKLKHHPREVGGSPSKEFNYVLLKQVIGSLWTAHAADKEAEIELFDAAAAALAGIKPKDEIEGMLAAQMVAAHSATMECYRRAMNREQIFEVWKEQLNQANKLSRAYTMQIEALSRYRGKGQQKVTVEHVHVHAGGQAMVGNIESSRDRSLPSEEKMSAIAYAPEPTLSGPDQTPDPLPVASNEDRSLSDARRKVSGSTKR